MIKFFERVKIVLILIAFVFLLTGCSGKDADRDVSQKNIKKPVVTKKEVKKIVKTETEAEDDEDLEMDFEEKDDDSELEKDFKEEEDISDESEEDKTDLDDEGDSYSGRIRKISLQPETIRGDSDIKIFVHLIPGLSKDESILINFRKSGSIEIANNPGHVFKKELFNKGDVVSFDIMLVKDDNIIEERRLNPVLVANSNPKITLMPSITTSSFKVYTYDVKAEDIDGDSITFELEGDVPPGMKIDGFTGRITYNFNSPPPNEKYVFNVVARDPDEGEDIKEVSLVFKKKTVKKTEE